MVEMRFLGEVAGGRYGRPGEEEQAGDAEQSHRPWIELRQLRRRRRKDARHVPMRHSELAGLSQFDVNSGGTRADRTL